MLKWSSGRRARAGATAAHPPPLARRATSAAAADLTEVATTTTTAAPGTPTSSGASATTAAAAAPRRSSKRRRDDNDCAATWRGGRHPLPRRVVQPTNADAFEALLQAAAAYKPCGDASAQLPAQRADLEPGQMPPLLAWCQPLPAPPPALPAALLAQRPLEPFMSDGHCAALLRGAAAAGMADALAARVLAQLLHAAAALPDLRPSPYKQRPASSSTSSAAAPQAKLWHATVAHRVARLLAEDTPPEEADRLAQARSFLASV